MCLTTVYIQSDDQRIKVMQDVTQMEYKKEGYLLIGMLGEQKYVKGKIRSVDFIDDHTVVLEKDGKIQEEKNDT
jgi:predicted RNA-binding protein